MTDTQNKYLDKLDEWDCLRDDGQLSEVLNEAFTSECRALWLTMSPEERTEIYRFLDVRNPTPP